MARKKAVTQNTNTYVDNFDIDDSLFFGLQLNDEQKEYRDAMFNDENQVVIVNSVAGSGKTLLAVASACILVKQNKYDGAEYIFATPQERSLGYTTGDVAEKERKYLLPLYDALEAIDEDPSSCIGNDILNKKKGTDWINAYSHVFQRGCNLQKRFVICDECQNWTIPELKKVISRCHDDCKVLLLGCNSQIDIEPKQSGFQKCIDYLKVDKRVKVCKLTKSYRGWLASYIDGLK